MIFKVNRGNTKTGKQCYVINFPPITTCRLNAPCASICYAMKAYRLYPQVKTCYDNNLMSWRDRPKEIMWEILAQIPEKKSVCRLFASGDFSDINFFLLMVEIAKARPLTTFYAYTKQYEIVNCAMDLLKGILPENLKIIFSEWDGLLMPNPYNFPVARVILKSDTLLVKAIKLKSGKLCGCQASCYECGYCWKMKSGQAVLFDQH